MSVDSSLEWPPQQHFILVCLSRLVGAHVQWEKDSGEARKTSKHLKTNHSLSLVFRIPLAYERQSLCFLKLPLKNFSIHFFILSQHVRPLDVWRPCQCPCSSFSCRWQVQSFRNGQEQPLLWLPSFCVAHRSYWQASKSIPDWGRVCLSGSPEAAVLITVHPPTCLPGLCQAHSWKGGGVVQGRTNWLHTCNTFCLFALGKTAAFSVAEKFLGLAVSRTGCPLLRSVEYRYHGLNLLLICQSLPTERVRCQHTFGPSWVTCFFPSSVLLITCTALWRRSPGRMCAFS